MQCPKKYLSMANETKKSIKESGWMLRCFLFRREWSWVLLFLNDILATGKLDLLQPPTKTHSPPPKQHPIHRRGSFRSESAVAGPWWWRWPPIDDNIKGVVCARAEHLTTLWNAPHNYNFASFCSAFISPALAALPVYRCARFVGAFTLFKSSNKLVLSLFHSVYIGGWECEKR